MKVPSGEAVMEALGLTLRGDRGGVGSVCVGVGVCV